MLLTFIHITLLLSPWPAWTEAGQIVGGCKWDSFRKWSNNSEMSPKQLEEKEGASQKSSNFEDEGILSFINRLLKVKGIRQNVKRNVHSCIQLFLCMWEAGTFSFIWADPSTTATGKRPKCGSSLSLATNMLPPTWHGDRWRSVKWWARGENQRKQTTVGSQRELNRSAKWEENEDFWQASCYKVLLFFFFFCCMWEPMRTQAVGWLTSTVKQLKAPLVHQGSSYIWRLWQEYTEAAGSLQPATRALCSPDIWNSNRGEIHHSSKCYSFIYRFDDSCRKHNHPDCLLAFPSGSGQFKFHLQ